MYYGQTLSFTMTPPKHVKICTLNLELSACLVNAHFEVACHVGSCNSPLQWPSVGKLGSHGRGWDMNCDMHCHNYVLFLFAARNND